VTDTVTSTDWSGGNLSQLCDVCRQKMAVHTFIDNGHHLGTVDRHLCDDCFGAFPISAEYEWQLKLRLGRDLKCQSCGDIAYILSGIPGPDREVKCYKCSGIDPINKPPIPTA
jgi:hypothetical protein